MGWIWNRKQPPVAGKSSRSECSRQPFPLAALRRIAALFRSLRRGISRREWTVRLLGLELVSSEPDAPGVILLQIDGLSRNRFERALASGKMPFLEKLRRTGDHRVASFYSGLPSTTPAVQAELFFGTRTAVPAFAFRDAETQQTIEMIQPAAAAKIERIIERSAPGLIEGGSAYCNIFAGGAREPHFCASAIGAGNLLGRAGRGRMILVALWNLMAVIRSLGMLAAEFVVAVSDFFRGVLKGHDVWAEFKLVPSRVIVAVLIRELIAIGAEADATRGLPIIHANFLGYDEQAHGRGPDSAMARWALRQIDGAIARIVRAARASRRRDYQIWLYSDHGQEASSLYQDPQGRMIEQVVDDLFEPDECKPRSATEDQPQPVLRGIQNLRAGWFGGSWAKRLAETFSAATGGDAVARPTVVAKGPLGHIYLPSGCDPQTKSRLAARLASEAHIPWVFAPCVSSGVQAWHRDSMYRLPEDAETVFGREHPFLAELVEDWERVCRHRDAGDLIISGWQTDGATVSFVSESGSHGGPGSEETGGFLMIPADVRIRAGRSPAYWRPSLVRQAVLKTIAPEKTRAELAASSSQDRSPPSLRIMTYNIHRCVGTDGRLSPARIARMIASCDPDLVALQEVDLGRAATGHVDQAAWIARELEMECTFHPSIVSGSESYGNAILSRVPVRVRRLGLLPVLAGAPRGEPRGALWVTVACGDFNWQLFATHLGLSRRERQLQMAALLGPDWLGHPECDGPVVLCGDFNAHSNSSLYRQLAARFRDVQTAVAGHRPRNTWFSRYPLLRLDHLFVSPELVVKSVRVPDSYLAGVASDHRPVIVDLESQTTEPAATA